MLDFKIFTKRKINVKKWQELGAIYRIKATVVVIDVFDYPIRGFSFNGPLIVIMDHPKETEKSLLWVFAHELRHLVVKKTKHLQDALFNGKRNILVKAIDGIVLNKNQPNYLKKTLLPEEIEADTFASEIAKGYYGSEWWEKNLKNKV